MQRKETSIQNAFTVETIVAMYYLSMVDYKNAGSQKNGVVYDFWQLLYLDRGHYTCCINGRRLTLQAGQLLLCEPEKVRHTLEQTDAMLAIISFRCSGSMAEMKNRVMDISDEERTLLSRLLSVGTDKFRSIPDGQQFFGQQTVDGTTDYELQAIKNNLELLLIRLHEKDGKTRKTTASPQNQVNYYSRQFWLIENYLKSHVNRNLTVADIAAGTGFSVSTVKRICSHHAGCGAVHYFIGLKLKEAKHLLQETDMTITQIAEVLGFSSVHYFSRMFKAETGLSPRQYAKSLLKN